MSNCAVPNATARGRRAAACALVALLALPAPAASAADVAGKVSPPLPAARLTAAEVYRQSRSAIAEVAVLFQVTTKLDNHPKFGGGTGTGFLIDRAGDFVTNCHVVDSAQATGPVSVTVQLSDETAWRAGRVLGCDRTADIAVVHVDGVTVDHQPLRFADPGSYAVGDDVMAIGFGLALDGEPSSTQGKLSALHRSTQDGEFGDLVQFDAAINHGNSGGPLLDMSGSVVGITSYSTTSSVKLDDITEAEQGRAAGGTSRTISVDVASGIFYARSAATSRDYARQIIASGRVERADLGITAEAIDTGDYHLPRLGVRIKDVRPGSVAERHGLKPDEVLTSIEFDDGTSQTIASPGDLEDAYASMMPGRSVTLHVFELTDAVRHAAWNWLPISDSDLSWKAVILAPGDAL